MARQNSFKYTYRKKNEYTAVYYIKQATTLNKKDKQTSVRTNDQEIPEGCRKYSPEGLFLFLRKTSDPVP